MAYLLDRISDGLLLDLLSFVDGLSLVRLVYASKRLHRLITAFRHQLRTIRPTRGIDIRLNDGCLLTLSNGENFWTACRQSFNFETPKDCFIYSRETDPDDRTKIVRQYADVSDEPITVIHKLFELDISFSKLGPVEDFDWTNPRLLRLQKKVTIRRFGGPRYRLEKLTDRRHYVHCGNVSEFEGAYALLDHILKWTSFDNFVPALCEDAELLEFTKRLSTRIQRLQMLTTKCTANGILQALEQLPNLKHLEIQGPVDNLAKQFFASNRHERLHSLIFYDSKYSISADEDFSIGLDCSRFQSDLKISKVHLRRLLKEWNRGQRQIHKFVLDIHDRNPDFNEVLKGCLDGFTRLDHEEDLRDVRLRRSDGETLHIHPSSNMFGVVIQSSVCFEDERERMESMQRDFDGRRERQERHDERVERRAERARKRRGELNETPEQPSSDSDSSISEGDYESAVEYEYEDWEDI